MRKSRKTIKIFLIAIILLFSSGCVKFNANMEIKKDKSMDFNIIYAIDKNFLDGEKIIDDDEKKELEDAKNDLEETYKKYGWVEKETVNTILAKFNTEIMDGGLNTPASDDYMVVDNGKYWFALTDDVAFYLKPVESSGNKEKDILDMSAIYMDNDKYDETTAIKYTKLLIKANNEEITDSEIDELLKEAKEKSSAKETANNGKGISVGISNANDHYEYQVIRLFK